MKNFSELSLQALLFPNAYPCSCGKTHAAELRYVRNESGALSDLPNALAAIGVSHPFILCDTRTKDAAWARTHQVLKSNHIPYALYTLPGDAIEPDAHTMGRIVMAYDPCCDGILAIGSGVLNDAAKVLAHAVQKPCAVIATAPSMDGYASNSSSMIVEGVKTTLYNAPPSAIISDTDIVRMAPMRMLWSGFGDMIAKYVALCEWRIAHIVIGEYYCENVAALMRAALARVMNNVKGLASREPAAVEAIMEGLILSGLAMRYAGVSRPASGLEHYFSHIWEMQALDRGQPADLHGIQVGVGTLITFKLLASLQNHVPTKRQADNAFEAFSPQTWEAEVHRVFGKSAPQIIAIEKETGKNGRARHDAHVQTILDHWPEIQNIIKEELPAFDVIASHMDSLGMPQTPQDLHVTHQDVMDAFIHSRDIRDKYLTSSLLWDLGLMDCIHP